jgi:hypothetical protein
VILIALSALLLASAPSVNPATPIDCPKAQRVNTSIGGSDAHNDQISARFVISVGADDVWNQFVGYEYQTYGGPEFIDFNFGPSLTFYKLRDGSIFDAFKTRITRLGMTQSSLAAPFASLTPATQFARTPCASQD